MPNEDLKPIDSTREHLVDIAEKLFIEKGPDEVSLRAIVREAGQKNQSALQYHFGNRDGLILAILLRRTRQLEARRRVLVDEALAINPNPNLREVCALMARTPFLLCREDKSFREFLGQFGQQLLASDRDIASSVADHSLPSLAELRVFVLQALSHLEPALLLLRAENAYALALLAISRRARRGGSFRGQNAELFFNNLVDQIAAMLIAPVSDETQALLGANE